MRDSLVKVGAEPKDAAVVAEVLIESDKRGHDTHGVGRLKPIYYDRIKVFFLFHFFYFIFLFTFI